MREYELRDLARGNEHRQKVLAGRAERAKSTSRRLTCALCLKTAYSLRAKEDICEECVAKVWRAEDVSEKAALAEKGEGFGYYRFSGRSHDLPYFSTQLGSWSVPKDAFFAVPRGYDDRIEESPGSTGQILFHEILMGLSEAYPLPPDKEANAQPLLGTAYSFDRYVVLPTRTVEAIYKLWAFMQWTATASYEQGLQDGRDLLGQLNTGGLTMDGFSNQIAKQTAQLREVRERNEKGRPQK